MNKQLKKLKDGSFSYGIEWTHVFGLGTGYTSNPIRGCEHACRWKMPDGNIAICYAESVANRIAREFYPNGFAAHYYDPKELQKWRNKKEPCGIFLDSMADLMGNQVPASQIEEVLKACADTPQHRYITLTKNAPRLLDFHFPDNVWVLVSSPPDFMFGKALTHDQQVRMLARQTGILKQLKARGQAKVTGISAEPLSWDITLRVAEMDLDWMIIGAASNGREIYQPNPKHVEKLEDLCDKEGIAVFHKGNVRPIVRRVREEFPHERAA